MAKPTNKLDKYKDFALEYVRTLSLQKAAENCGIHIRTAHRLVKDPNIRKFIDEELTKINNKKIADGKEVLEYLTSIMRGEQVEKVPFVIGTGEGFSEVTIVDKDVGAKERLKAAELLGKVYGIYTQNVEMNSTVQVVFEDEKDLED